MVIYIIISTRTICTPSHYMTTPPSQTLKANLTIVADGCFSRFRTGLSDAKVLISSHFVGIVMHDCPQFCEGYAEIVLAKTGPILIYQISSNATRVLVDIQGKMPSDIKAYMETVIGPQLPGIYARVISQLFHIIVTFCYVGLESCAVIILLFWCIVY